MIRVFIGPKYAFVLKMPNIVMARINGLLRLFTNSYNSEGLNSAKVVIRTEPDLKI